MDPMTLDALVARAEQTPDTKRVSFEPIDGYVLNPWSGLYQETDTTYMNRLAAEVA
ncbi:hypothetical protein [Dyella sp. 2HG41-7]|uniref:hypothetical protein n=1 Tax=Dyella sp. 2HG41-7 TaxID=2883239 RepID=UPI001F17D429|nr:hypothetical protein [Dyella sp. 2HG41-7]